MPQVRAQYWWRQPEIGFRRGLLPAILILGNAILIWDYFSSARLPENEISMLTFAGPPCVGKAKRTTPVLFLFRHDHFLGTVIDTQVWIWSVKATDGWNRIDPFSIPRAHMVLFVYLLSILLQGIAKPNSLEKVCIFPSRTVDVFEAENSSESDSETCDGALSSTMSVFDFFLLRKIQMCSDVL